MREPYGQENTLSFSVDDVMVTPPKVFNARNSNLPPGEPADLAEHPAEGYKTWDQRVAELEAAEAAGITWRGE